MEQALVSSWLGETCKEAARRTKAWEVPIMERGGIFPIIVQTC